MTANRHNSIFYGVDLWTVLLYVLIVMAGWVSITSASYDEVRPMSSPFRTST